MPRRADILINTANVALFKGGATRHIVQTPTGVIYVVYIDAGSDVYFKKSSDYGLSWSAPTQVFSGNTISLSIWYDRWSGIAAGLIHCAYTETGGHDTLYRTINTESSDALSTQTTIFAGTSAVATGSFLSISRARGGNVYCRTQIDAGAEGAFMRLSNANVPNGAWDAARTINEANATLDQMLLLPGFAADNQDMIAIFWDASANEISRQLYDDSANTWAETSIATGFVEVSTATTFPHFAAAVDLTNSKILLIAWNGVDTANADLEGWTIDESAITAWTTDPVVNGTDDQGACAISIDLVTGWWWVFYCGKSDGTETWASAVNLYCKVSKDSGATWGPETLLTSRTFAVTGIYSCPRTYLREPPCLYVTDGATVDEEIMNIDITQANANLLIGL